MISQNTAATADAAFGKPSGESTYVCTYIVLAVILKNVIECMPYLLKKANRCMYSHWDVCLSSLVAQLLFSCVPGFATFPESSGCETHPIRLLNFKMSCDRKEC